MVKALSKLCLVLIQRDWNVSKFSYYVIHKPFGCANLDALSVPCAEGQEIFRCSRSSVTEHLDLDVSQRRVKSHRHHKTASRRQGITNQFVPRCEMYKFISRVNNSTSSNARLLRARGHGQYNPKSEKKEGKKGKRRFEAGVDLRGAGARGKTIAHRR